MNTTSMASFAASTLVPSMLKQLTKLAKDAKVNVFTPDYTIPFSATNPNCVVLSIANNDLSKNTDRKVSISLQPQFMLDAKTELPVVPVVFEDRIPGKLFAVSTTRHYMSEDTAADETIMQCHATKRVLHDFNKDISVFLLLGKDDFRTAYMPAKEDAEKLTVKQQVLADIENIRLSFAS